MFLWIRTFSSRYWGISRTRLFLELPLKRSVVTRRLSAMAARLGNSEWDSGKPIRTTTFPGQSQMSLKKSFHSILSRFVVGSVLLIAGEGRLPPLESRHHFVEYLFDTVSAFGTVGLSMGVTPKLNDLQKYALILMMFVGRVGPLTLAFSLSRDTGGKSLTYAEEGVMVG